MRRWVCILLLVFVPLHFSWAAAALPCGDHARDAQPQQFSDDGHAHQHDASVVFDDEAGGPASAGHDGNCCDCLAHCATALFPTAGMPSFDPVAHTTPWTQPGTPAPAPSLPERPQWLVLA